MISLNSYDAFILTLPKVILARPPLPSRYFYPPQIIDEKVLFAFYIYLIRSIIKIVSMISWIVKIFYFDTTKIYPNSTLELVRYFDPPPPRYFYPHQK